MEIVILGSGTSQGIPIIGCTCEACVSNDPRDKRLRSSVFVRTEKVKIQVDVGPDFRAQYLENELSSIDYVLFTHEHNDHVIGIDDLRAVNFIQKKQLPLLAEERVLGEIKKRFDYAFAAEKYPGVPDISLHEISTEAFRLGDIDVTPIRVIHGKLPILGFKFNDFAYITDASMLEQSEIDKMYGVKVLIINALRETKHYSHFTLQEALDCIEKINPEKAYLTHISHMMGPTRAWEQKLPSRVLPLQDKMRIILPD